jgi:hypothetical protein
MQTSGGPSSRQEHTMRADIAPGGTFPDYELTDHTKVRRRLSELQGNDPMILLLARGHFCPKDHQQHLELAATYPKIAVAYTRIVTISTDPIFESNEFRASGSGAGPPSSISGTTCATPRGRSVPTGTSARRACARRGRPATARASTVGRRWNTTLRRADG